MSIKDPMNAFLVLLSNVRRTTERSAKIYTELGELANDPDVKASMDARAFVQTGSLAKIDEVFRLIDKKPLDLPGTIQDAFIEEFRTEFKSIESQPVRRLYVLAKAIRLAHFRIGEWVALVAAADFTRTGGVGVLLETCLAEDLAFAERTRRFLRKLAEAKVAAATSST